MSKSDWRIVTDGRDRLGESPQWNSATQELFWIDFYGPTLHRWSPRAGRKDWAFPQFETVGSLVVCEDGRLLVAFDNGLFVFDPEDGSLTAFADPNQQREGVSYNDAKVDPLGRYWVGTFDAAETAPRGVLYSVDPNGKWRVGDAGFVVCNGPAFSPRGDVMYFNDSIGRQTLAYDLDRASGRLTRRRVFHSYAEPEGLPDGLCVDASGDVWCALYGGGAIVRLSPEGDRLETLDVPAPNVTSCCFGGPDLDTIFVTTGHSADPDDDRGGAVFAIVVDAKGLSAPLFRIPHGPANETP